jgi:hypothetical protein
MKEFSSPTERNVRVIEFSLDGVEYHFTAPKTVGLFATSNTTKDFLNWLGEGLPDEEGKIIADRLADPDDTLDLDQINEIARYLMGQIAARPTKRR